MSQYTPEQIEHILTNSIDSEQIELAIELVAKHKYVQFEHLLINIISDVSYFRLEHQLKLLAAMALGEIGAQAALTPVSEYALQYLQKHPSEAHHFWLVIIGTLRQLVTKDNFIGLFKIISIQLVRHNPRFAVSIDSSTYIYYSDLLQYAAAAYASIGTEGVEFLQKVAGETSNAKRAQVCRDLLVALGKVDLLTLLTGLAEGLLVAEAHIVRRQSQLTLGMVLSVLKERRTGVEALPAFRRIIKLIFNNSTATLFYHFLSNTTLNYETRRTLMELLSELEDKNCLESLLEIARNNDDHPFVRHSAITNLFYIFAKPLADVWVDQDISDRPYSWKPQAQIPKHMTLFDIDGTQILKPFLQLMRTGSAEVQQVILRRLGKCTDESFIQVIITIAESNSSIQGEAIGALGRLVIPDVAKHLIRIIQTTGSDEIKWHTSLALCHYPSAEVVQVLAENLSAFYYKKLDYEDHRWVEHERYGWRAVANCLLNYRRIAYVALQNRKDKASIRMLTALEMTKDS